jgi:anti-sigma B factor antagonist
MMNSIGLGCLVRGHVKFARRGAHLRVCCLDPRMKQVFEITKLVRVFELFECEKDALAACEKPE